LTATAENNITYILAFEPKPGGRGVEKGPWAPENFLKKDNCNNLDKRKNISRNNCNNSNQ
jgi:hypothetical protein